MRSILATGALAAALTLAQGGFSGPGRYEILNLKSGKVMDLDRNDQTTVIQFSARGTASHQWDIQPTGDGFYLIRNAMNGKALQVTANSNSAPLICGRFDGGPAQQWRIEPGKDGNALIISRTGKTIDVPDGASRDGLRLQIYDPNGDSNQRFILRRAGGGGGSGFGGGRDRDFDARDRDDRNRQPDRSGRFWNDREQMWNLAGDGVCFYQQPGFRGDAVCVRSGIDIPDADRAFNGPFGSARFFGRSRTLEIFEREGFRGDRDRLTRDKPDLGRTRIGSFRVK